MQPFLRFLALLLETAPSSDEREPPGAGRESGPATRVIPAPAAHQARGDPAQFVVDERDEFTLAHSSPPLARPGMSENSYGGRAPIPPPPKKT